jgi:hypothetical protein
LRLPDSQCRAHNATIRGQRPSRANIGIRPRVYQVGEGNRYARDQRRMAWVPCSILMPVTVWRWQYQEREETDRNGGIVNGDGDPHPSCRNRTSNPYGCGSITEPILKGQPVTLFVNHMTEIPIPQRAPEMPVRERLHAALANYLPCRRLRCDVTA